VTIKVEIKDGQLAELLSQVQAGHEVVLTRDQEPVAKLVAIRQERPVEKLTELREFFKTRSLKGHRVLKPDFTHAEIADEMFGQK
jgi:antitoxin (DNA-binding transcriptional repressor) of toxin-antitoxin stability system